MSEKSQVLKYSGHHSSKFNVKFNFKLMGKRGGKENGHCCRQKSDKQDSFKNMPMIFYNWKTRFYINWFFYITNDFFKCKDFVKSLSNLHTHIPIIYYIYLKQTSTMYLFYKIS